MNWSREEAQKAYEAALRQVKKPYVTPTLDPIWRLSMTSADEAFLRDCGISSE